MATLWVILVLAARPMERPVVSEGTPEDALTPAL
jgi:hypothetical protein